MAVERFREITSEQRVEAFQEAVNQVRSAAHLLADYEIWAALDETKRCLFFLDRQLATLKESPEREPSELELRPQRRGRRRGIEIIPGRVKQAREEAGLSLRDVAGVDVTRAAICLIENGKSRPSQLTLDLIARRTGRPISFFTGEAG